ncbi:MAG: hypothetical protein Q9201_001184 [Fulgogasparrea decipioides]
MPREPVATDFPSHIHLSIVQRPYKQSPVNILIFLHGLGDTKESFTHLANQMSLPETTCISLQGPNSLPFDLGGFHWGDDITFDQSAGTMDYDTGFDQSSKVVGQEVIEKVLIQKYGYKPRNILLFGYGQGGMTAIAAALTLRMELGGIVSIGGPRPSSVSNLEDGGIKNETPIIVLGGSSSTLITQSALTSLKDTFRYVEYAKWSKPGDGMPRNKDEMLPIMKFFARRLQSRSSVPEDAIEVG